MHKDPNKLTTSKKGERLNIAAGIYVTEVYVNHTPKYSWLQALKDAGYALSYAQARTAELWAKAEQIIAKAKEKLIIKQSWDLDWIDGQYRALYEDCRSMSDKTNAKGCLDSMSRRLSGFSDNLNVGKDNKTLDLDASDTKAVEDATRALNLRLSKPKTGTNDD